MMEYLIKNFNGTLKDVDSVKRIVSGYYAVFGNKDSDNDMIMPGAFKKTISERGHDGTKQIMHLLQHDSWKALGKPKILREDQKGLYFETEIINTSYGSDTLKLYEGGVYNEHSIGYRVVKSETDKLNNQNYKKLIELFLWEGSTVTWGANSLTSFDGFKSLDKKTIYKEIQDRIERISKAAKIGTLTDETLYSFELALAQLNELIKTLEPVVTTPEPFDAINYMLNNLKFIQRG